MGEIHLCIYLKRVPWHTFVKYKFLTLYFLSVCSVYPLKRHILPVSTPSCRASGAKDSISNSDQLKKEGPARNIPWQFNSSLLVGNYILGLQATVPPDPDAREKNVYKGH